MEIFHQQYAGVNNVVETLDEPGIGNACHSYRLVNFQDQEVGSDEITTTLDFQHGPVLEAGINGIQNEQLIAVCIHRLQGFQSGPFSCRENALAITKLQEALMWLEARTKDRSVRGVEGTNQA